MSPTDHKKQYTLSISENKKRHCTEWTKFVKHLTQLLAFLSLRGYPPTLTIPALHRCNNISQWEALMSISNNQNSDDSLFCITEFNPLNPLIKEWINELWPIQKTNLGMRILVDKRIIFGHSKPDSLQDILAHINIFGEKRYVNKPPQRIEYENAKNVLELVNLGK